MFRCVDIISANPTVLFVCIFVTESFDEIPEPHLEALVDLQINDLLDFKMCAIICNFHSSWRRFLMTEKWIQEMGLELRNVEYQMNPGECLG